MLEIDDLSDVLDRVPKMNTQLLLFIFSVALVDPFHRELFDRNRELCCWDQVEIQVKFERLLGSISCHRLNGIDIADWWLNPPHSMKELASFRFSGYRLVNLTYVTALSPLSSSVVRGRSPFLTLVKFYDSVSSPNPTVTDSCSASRKSGDIGRGKEGWKGLDAGFLS